MQAILDYTTSFLVGATVLLMVGAITETSLEAALGGHEHHVARSQELVLASLMTQDLRNVGAAGADDPIVSGTDSSLIVQAPVRRGDSASTITYRRIYEGRPEDTPIYRVEREVDGSVTAVAEDVRDWRIYCLDGEGDTLSYGGTDYQTETRSFAVEIVVAPGAGEETLGSGESIERRWSTRLHPFHLGG